MGGAVLIDARPTATHGHPVASEASALAARIHPPMPDDRWLSWVITAVLTALGGLLRWPSLATPKAFVFDETYYTKDALSLLTFGYERGFVDKADAKILASTGDPESLRSVFTDGPAFVVHPPVGKWVIAIGEWAFGVTPFGWRFMVALLGTVAVALTFRIARRLTRSTMLGAIAGLLIALDGMAIVHSRTALLDPVLMFLVLLAFGAILLDRDQVRARAAGGVARGTELAIVGRRLGRRPWLLAAGISLGLACGTKWSGVYFLVAFGLVVVAWDVTLRRRLEVDRPFMRTVTRDLPVLVLSFAAVPLFVYLLSWTGWFLSDTAYDRQWAATDPASGIWVVMPDALRSLWHYHAEMLGFHRNLSSPHAYQSNPWGWLLQTRPTSYFYESPKLGAQNCAVDTCSAEVLALGNPVIWWAGTLALLHQAWRWVAVRDWRSGAVVVGFLAGWLPWLFFQQRTIFTFYSIAFLPFVILALTLSLGAVIGPSNRTDRRAMTGAVAVGSLLLAVVTASWFFYPIWTAQVIPYAQWQLRMWLPTWV